jgi:nucleotide-binding universal stress UspA family protein
VAAIQLNRLLCPIDLSDASRHALEHAVALAKWCGAQITVLHVYHIPIPPVPLAVPAVVPLQPPLDPRQLEDNVRRFCEPVASAGVSLEIVIAEGVPSTQIVRHAEEMLADLLAMGTHGHGGFERLFLGSVTEKVIRSVRCPVLTVPPPAGPPVPDRALFKTILCPLDFSNSSLRAAEYALSIAKEADAQLILLHVIDSFLEERLDSADVQLDSGAYRSVLEERAMSRLRAVVPEEARTWCKPDERIVYGKPHREILRVASESSAEAIFMGVHGRGVIDRMLFGSTTHHVIREAPCPVLTLRA